MNGTAEVLHQQKFTVPTPGLSLGRDQLVDPSQWPNEPQSLMEHRGVVKNMTNTGSASYPRGNRNTFYKQPEGALQDPRETEKMDVPTPAPMSTNVNRRNEPRFNIPPVDPGKGLNPIRNPIVNHTAAAVTEQESRRWNRLEVRTLKALSNPEAWEGGIREYRDIIIQLILHHPQGTKFEKMTAAEIEDARRRLLQLDDFQWQRVGQEFVEHSSRDWGMPVPDGTVRIATAMGLPYNEAIKVLQTGAGIEEIQKEVRVYEKQHK